MRLLKQKYERILGAGYWVLVTGYWVLGTVGKLVRPGRVGEVIRSSGSSFYFRQSRALSAEGKAQRAERKELRLRKMVKEKSYKLNVIC